MAKTMTMQECADYLHISRTTLLKLARSGEIQGSKLGKCWIFLDEHVSGYLFSQIEEQTHARRKAHEQQAGARGTPAELPAKKKRGGQPLPISTDPVY